MDNYKDEENVPLSTRIERIPYIGYIAMVFSALFFSFLCLGVNLLKNDMNPIETLLISYFFVSLVYFSATIFENSSFKPPPGETISLVFRCAFGAFTGITVYKATTLLNMGDATAIILTAPIYVTFIAFIFLGEPCEMLFIVIIAVNTVGVILIAKPSFIFSHFSRTNHTRNNTTTVDYSSSESLTGLILANAAALGTAGFIVALRKLRETPISVIIFWNGLTTLICCFIYLAIANDVRVPVTSKPYWLLTFSATSIVLAQYFQTIALKVEKAGPVALVRQVQVVFAYIEQVLILKQKLTWTSVVGAIIITCTVTLPALHKLWLRRKDNGFGKSEQLGEVANEQANTLQPNKATSKIETAKSTEESNEDQKH